MWRNLSKVAFWWFSPSDKRLYHRTKLEKKSQLNQKIKTFTSAAVAFLWKILVSPRWISGGLPIVDRTETIIWCISGCELVTSAPSISKTEVWEVRWVCIDSAISETASRRAPIMFLSRNGWVTCKIWNYTCTFYLFILSKPNKLTAKNLHTQCLRSLEPNKVRVWFIQWNKEPDSDPSKLFIKTYIISKITNGEKYAYRICWELKNCRCSKVDRRERKLLKLLSNCILYNVYHT